MRERTAQYQVVNQELESFCFSVSHDLRAPLRHIQGYSRILQEETADSLTTEARLCLDRICRATTRMGDLIDDLLNLSRVTRGEISICAINLSAMVREIVAELTAATPERPVCLSIEPDVRVYGDPRLIRIMMENLLGNAWKYTGKKERPEITFGTRQEGEELVCFVRDNGAGFDMAYADKLFGVFQRLHRADEFEGTGVGLATVQRIINRHHGRIWAESAPDAGATFFFVLPRGN